MSFVYNTVIKNKYLDYVWPYPEFSERDRKYGVVLWFDNFEKFENKFGKDLSQFTEEEILEGYREESSWNSLAFFRNVNIRFSHYTNWYKENIDEQTVNAYSEIPMSSLASIALGKQKIDIVTRKDLDLICAALVNPRDQYSIVALFEGLRGSHYSEILDLRINDVDFENLTVFVERRGKSIKISQKLADIISNAYKTYTYLLGNGRSGFRALSDLQDGKVYHITSNSVESADPVSRGRTFQRAVDRALFDSSNGTLDISLTRIQDSGIIEFIKTRAKELGITPKEYFEEKNPTVEIYEQYNKLFRKDIFWYKYGDYLK